MQIKLLHTTSKCHNKMIHGMLEKQNEHDTPCGKSPMLLDTLQMIETSQAIFSKQRSP